ncbi:MAG: CoB--CoM heterodisulfide reductase iron-sulfur subunit A family protein [Candidatus Eisenbacteria bacterium]|nr:CoB--CoM heterodisulfide reductase iron-sulfur subunit A family protein [Candidatus Eisenbacteria bacterium]
MKGVRSDDDVAASSDEIRIGVFICKCGTNIAGFLDTKVVSDYSRTLPSVVFSRENLFSCSEAGVTDIRNAIKEQNLNRVVVAACTPRTHEPVFRAACEEAGLNKYLFEFVNIREQCSWVHKASREIATEKAKDLVRMGVARATRLEPKEEITADVARVALVIGGGISGLTCALSLARRGFPVKLVEREKELGGLLTYVNRLYPSNISASEFIAEKIRDARRDLKIEIMTSSIVTDVRGYIGKYEVSVSSSGEMTKFVCGVIVVATGAEELIPDGYFGYDGKKVIRQIQLEEMMKRGKLEGKRFVMILCAGARVRERIYCSRICCTNSIKNAMLIKEAVPDSSVHILYRDLQCYGVKNEEMYLKAKQMGVRFVNYSLDNPPVVEAGRVSVLNPLTGRKMVLDADLVILSSPLVPRKGVEKVSRMLKVPLDENKFFLEAHVKLRPMDFATDGIYVCGTAHWPSSTSESIYQALGAAARASIPLTRGYVKVEPIVSELVDEDACRGCGMCAAACPYGAIEIVDTEKGPKARMTNVACKGCGVCAAMCYKSAIGMSHYTDEQLDAQVRAYLRGET